MRVGAAGGLGKPEAVAAAFALGADFVLTGSTTTKALLAALARTDVRLLLLGGAGILIVPGGDGATVADTPDPFPAVFRTSRWHPSTRSRPAAPRPGWIGPISARPR